MEFKLEKSTEFTESRLFEELCDRINPEDLEQNISNWTELFPDDLHYEDFIKNQELVEDKRDNFTYRNTIEFDQYVISASSKVVVEDDIVVDAEMVVKVVMGPLAGQGFAVKYRGSEESDDKFLTSRFVS